MSTSYEKDKCDHETKDITKFPLNENDITRYKDAFGTLEDVISNTAGKKLRLEQIRFQCSDENKKSAYFTIAQLAEREYCLDTIENKQFETNNTPGDKEECHAIIYSLKDGADFAVICPYNKTLCERTFSHFLRSFLKLKQSERRVDVQTMEDVPCFVLCANLSRFADDVNAILEKWQTFGKCDFNVMLVILRNINQAKIEESSIEWPKELIMRHSIIYNSEDGKSKERKRNKAAEEAIKEFLNIKPVNSIFDIIRRTKFR